MRKTAFEYYQAEGAFGNTAKAVASTLGRLNTLPVAALVGQERIGDWLRDPEEKMLHDLRKDLRKDKRIHNTEIQVGHANPLRLLQRVWKNPHSTILDKTMGTLMSPLSAISSNLTRGNAYDPLSDSIMLYSNIPEIAKHELGHARDFNQKSPWLRSAYTWGKMMEAPLSPIFGGAGPLTQWMETRANQEGIEGGKPTPESRREYRRRTWPARSTYITAALAALAPYAANKGWLGEGAKDSWLGRDGNLLGRMGGSAMLGLIPGAMLGRGMAEVRNLFDPDKPKEKKKHMTTNTTHKKAALNPRLFGAYLSTVKSAADADSIMKMDGAGPVAADMIGLNVWGANRAGRAKAMQKAQGKDVPFSVGHPILSTTLGLTGGMLAGGLTGTLAGHAMSGPGLYDDSAAIGGLAGMGGGALLGLTLTNMLRRKRMREIHEGFEETPTGDLRPQRPRTNLGIDLLGALAGTGFVNKGERDTYRKLHGDTDENPRTPLLGGIASSIPFVNIAASPINSAHQGISSGHAIKQDEEKARRAKLKKVASINPRILGALIAQL